MFLRPRQTYDNRYEDSDLNAFQEPEWQLLIVNRQVRKEAVAIFLAENHFVLSYDNSTYQKLLYGDPDDELLLWYLGPAPATLGQCHTRLEKLL